MSALEKFGITFDEGLAYINNRLARDIDLDSILDNPLFVQFIAPNEEKLRELGFVLARDAWNYPGRCISTHMNGIRINYINRFDPRFNAFISCRNNDESFAAASIKNSGVWIRIEHINMDEYPYYSVFKSRMQTIDALAASEAENKALRERISALEAEILHLKLIPGGEEYEHAREHFKQLQDTL